MFEKFKERWRQPESRKVFAVILAGKLLGVGALLLLIKAASIYFATPALADDAAAAPPAYVNPMNTMWTLVAAFLVFFMQAGFMMLEAGFARTREAVNILLEGIVDTCLCGILFWAWGFAFMFGAGNGFIGKQFFFLHGAPETYWIVRCGDSGVLPVSIRLRRYLQHDHLGRDGGSHRIRRRLDLQLWRERFHLPDPRPLGVGDLMAGSTPSSRPPSTTSPVPPSCTPSAASWR